MTRLVLTFLLIIATAPAEIKELAAPKPNDYGWVAANPKPKWIWRADKTDNAPIFLRKSFVAPNKLASAWLYTTCDNGADVYLNGAKIGTIPDWGQPLNLDAGKFLKPGHNVFAVHAQNRGGIAAFVLKLRMEGVAPEAMHVMSDQTWKLSTTEQNGWEKPDFDDGAWNAKLKSFGEFGVAPWGIAGAQGPGGAPKRDPLDVANITVPDGFNVDLIHTVPKAEQGSWVSLTTDGKGRLLACDQGGKGLFRITVGDKPEQTRVERMPVELSGAQGLVWHDDALYFHRNGGYLYRVTDSDGDDKLDAAEQLPSSASGGEHGNHAAIVAEDGRYLYIDGGNHAALPPNHAISRNRVQSWDEDLLLPREWDANGHARGRLAPGGWISRFDPAAKTHEILSVGYRNQYDIALNSQGDLFTYDADMEWDMGTPWYRPTRINFAVSGSDYGWRSGSGKWPEYYEDSLPAVVNIGPGSPTGVVSGLGARFPQKYQDAIYALDWTFGTIYAIHLWPDGAGYRGESEPFCYGAPLPVTDAIVGQDGALYFTIGGRGTQSALFRITYAGDESTAYFGSAEDPEVVMAQDLRRRLEAYHGVVDATALDAAWPHLSSGDRWLRHAARVAVESQPVETWASRVFSEPNPQARITGAVALARDG